MKETELYKIFVKYESSPLYNERTSGFALTKEECLSRIKFEKEDMERCMNSQKCIFYLVKVGTIMEEVEVSSTIT